jgi:hypothetical protein
MSHLADSAANGRRTARLSTTASDSAVKEAAMNKQTLKRGALAGMGGGMAMAMWSMIVLWLAGTGFWTPLNLIASTLWRGAPLGAAFSGSALALGLTVHMMMSMGLGMAFAVGIRAIPRAAASPAALLLTGMMFGLAVWAVMQYGIWPAIDPAAAPRFIPWAFAAGHVVFGAVTALLTGVSLARRPRPAARLHGSLA